MIRSLYVHFPFCESKCHYCDFYSLGKERTRPGDPTAFEAALRKESEQAAPLLDTELDTIFFGGGTPSMTPPDSMARALEPILKRCKITPQTEWTMEANPSSINRENLQGYQKLGVNRISMGVQAMRDDLLLKLGRVHSREKALIALDTLFEVGFKNVSVDLLCGVPGQSLKDIEEALSLLTQFPITHLSCYLLTLPPHHRMFAELPHEDDQLAHLLFLDPWMTAHGFEHYEISNYARPGKQARHNLAYWKGTSYLGLGPSAHSFDARQSKRWKHVSSLHKYAHLLQTGQSPIEWTEILTEEQKSLERWMLALRLAEGFPESWLGSSTQKARAQALENEGFLEAHPQTPTRKRLTTKGFALSDQVIAALAR
ncbi:radical SAM family heme chaperone HemW [Bdellovibrionota bacterium FG-1]